MSNRPDPEMFARYSYLLAYVSSGIVLLAIVLSFIQLPIAGTLSNVIWLALVTGVAGTFMGFAAQSDFKRRPGSDDAVHAARVGLRLNFITTVVVALIALIGIAAQIFATTAFQAQP